MRSFLMRVWVPASGEASGEARAEARAEAARVTDTRITADVPPPGHRPSRYPWLGD